MQTDPIGQAGGLNIYAYVGGDPMNYTDPWGLTSCKPGQDCVGVRARNGTNEPCNQALTGVACGWEISFFLDQLARRQFAESMDMYAKDARAAAMKGMCAIRTGSGHFPNRHRHYRPRHPRYSHPDGAIGDAALGASSSQSRGTSEGAVRITDRDNDGDLDESPWFGHVRNIPHASVVQARFLNATQYSMTDTFYKAGASYPYVSDGGFNGGAYNFAIVVSGDRSNSGWRGAAVSVGVRYAYQALGGRSFRLRYFRTIQGGEYFC